MCRGKSLCPCPCTECPQGTKLRAWLEGVLSARLQRFKNRHQQLPARHGSFSEGIPGWGKGCTVREVQPWLMGSREKRGHSPFSALEWSNKELLISYMLFLTVIWCEKSLKRNLQSISGRASNWWEKTSVIFIHPKSLGNMIFLVFFFFKPINMQNSWNKCCCLLVEYFVSMSVSVIGARSSGEAQGNADIYCRQPRTARTSRPAPGNPGSSWGRAYASINQGNITPAMMLQPPRTNDLKRKYL